MNARLGVVLVALAVIGAGVGPLVMAQSGQSVYVDAPGEVTAGTTAEVPLLATNVNDPDGVGAYRVNVTYDSSAVDLSASDAGQFHVETDAADGRLTVVGYTGNKQGPTGSATLATIAIKGLSQGASTSIDVSVDELTDTRGDPLPHGGASKSLTVGAGSTTTTTAAPTTTTSRFRSGGGSGGGVPSAPDEVASGGATVDPDTGAVDVALSGGTFDRIELGLAVGTSGVSSVSELDGLPSRTGNPTGGSVVGVLEITVPASAKDQPATVRVTLPRDRLAERGLEPSELQVERFNDDAAAWEALPTSVVQTNDQRVVLEADTPGFSIFAVTQKGTTPTASSTATAGSSTAATTATATSPTSAPGPDESSPDDSPTPETEPGGFDYLPIAVAVLIVAVAVGAITLLRERNG